jgi:6-phosphogluconolactonase
MMSETLVARDPTEHAAFAADLLARAIIEAVDKRGVARVAVSGGETPVQTHKNLAAFSLPFDKVEWYWVDERAVPPDHPRSNAGAAIRDLQLGDGKHGRFHRMEAEREDLEAAARDYQLVLRKAFGVAGAVSFDAVALGIGDDGHTASMFPGLGITAIEDRLVAAVPAQPEKKLEARLTLTAPVILEARMVLMLACGASKRRPITLAKGAGPEEEIPARILHRAKGSVVWLLDEAAAGPWSVEPPPAPSSTKTGKTPSSRAPGR